MKLCSFLLVLIIATTSSFAEAGLRVYKADGTTVLGHFLGCADNPGLTCLTTGEGIQFSNTSTGAVSTLAATDVGSTVTLYFSGAGCTGTVTTSGSAIPTTTAYNNGVYYYGGSYFGNTGSASYRTWNGSCVTSAGATTAKYYAYPSGSNPACGYGNCLVKP